MLRRYKIVVPSYCRFEATVTVDAETAEEAIAKVDLDKLTTEDFIEDTDFWEMEPPYVESSEQLSRVRWYASTVEDLASYLMTLNSCEYVTIETITKETKAWKIVFVVPENRAIEDGLIDLTELMEY